MFILNFIYIASHIKKFVSIPIFSCGFVCFYFLLLLLLVQVPIVLYRRVSMFLNGGSDTFISSRLNSCERAHTVDFSSTDYPPADHSASFQVHFLHLHSPWAYDAVVCEKATKPQAEGHSKWSRCKASLWQQAWLASRDDCGTWGHECSCPGPCSRWCLGF